MAAAPLAAAGVLLAPISASAVCHVAAFTDESVAVSESAGQATLTVELVGGQPSCAGTVDYATSNGSATAPQDYT
ncbi:MAG: Calx-beta domain-containing protein, partial [Actinomycetota bacterium]